MNVSYKPGETYEVEIVLTRGDMLDAGFQLSVRFEDGTQAGSFETGNSVIVTPGINSDIQYLQHAPGTVATQGGNKSWTITWTAPDQLSGDIIFNIAANAANGDQSEFGDWIYVKEVRVV